MGNKVQKDMIKPVIEKINETKKIIKENGILNLSKLDLNCELMKETIEILKENSMPILKFDLSFNHIKEEGSKFLFEYLISLDSLKELDLYNNPLYDGGVNNLSTYLIQNKSLKKLTLANIIISQNGMKILSESLKKNSALDGDSIKEFVLFCFNKKKKIRFESCF